MSSDKRDILDVLRYELSFLENGGYQRVRDLGLPASIFQDSLTCLNHGDPLRSHACRECALYEFVPERGRCLDVPCYAIPVDDSGTTLEDISEPALREQRLAEWLRSTIAAIQHQRGEASRQRITL